MRPECIWWWSSVLYHKGLRLPARFLKLLNYILFHAILPPEAEIQKDIRLDHLGLGVVIHPNVRIGHRVHIHHQVTLASGTWVGSPFRIVIEDDVMLGAGAKIIARSDRSLTIGAGAKVGANAVVTRDVALGDTVVGCPARTIHHTEIKNCEE